VWGLMNCRDECVDVMVKKDARGKVQEGVGVVVGVEKKILWLPSHLPSS
jgi:hypothetical protein